MDEELVNRWRDGQPDAELAVRNAIRTIAIRVLTHPALRPPDRLAGAHPLRDDQARRELASAVALEVMQRGTRSVAQLRASALLVASRQALEAVRDGRPTGRESHVPSSVAVMMAIAPNAVPGPARAEAESHLEGCTHCRDDIRLVDTLVRAEAVADPNAGGELVEEGPEDEGGQAAVAVAAVRVPQPGTRSKQENRKEFHAIRVEAEEGRGRAWLPLALLLVVGVGFTAWALAGRAPGVVARTELGALANRELPELPSMGLPNEASGALDDLRAGDCHSGAARLKTVRRHHPELPEVAVLEAAAFVCDGDGAAAREALETLADSPTAQPGQAWVEAQAALLVGEERAARSALEVAARADPVRGADARALLVVLDER